MSVSHLPTEEIEENVRRLLAELASRKHPTGCDLIRVEMCRAGAALEVIDFRPVSPVSAALASLPSAGCGACG